MNKKITDKQILDHLEKRAKRLADVIPVQTPLMFKKGRGWAMGCLGFGRKPLSLRAAVSAEIMADLRFKHGA